MNYSNRLLLTITLILLMPYVTYAWNSVGHMVVANIAYQQLNPSVKSKVDRLIKYFEQEYPDINSFEQLAAWPDAIRSQKIDAFSRWHYIDVPFSDDGTPYEEKKLIDTDNAIWAIDEIKLPVKNNKANPYERVRFLAFLIHIIGDLHQPLHTVTRVSAQYPNGDHGGNFYPIHYNNVRNLHGLWDQGVGLFTGERSRAHAVAIANRIVVRYPKNYFGNKVNDLDPAHWANEGVNNAKLFVYSTKEGQSPNAVYISNGQKIVEEQVVLAGYRLAAILSLLL